MASKDQVLYPRITKKPPFSVEASGYEPAEGETIPRRNPAARDKLISTPEDGVATVFDIVKRGAEKFGNAKAIGTRRLIDTHVEVKKVKKMVDGVEQEIDKKWTYFELSEYSYLSFIEYERLALQIGAGLRKLGMNAGDRVHIFAATRWGLAKKYRAFF
jgi:long-chain acyl-CoA synthetase